METRIKDYKSLLDCSNQNLTIFMPLLESLNCDNLTTFMPLLKELN